MSMTVYPAIDLLGGQCVRLTEGNYDAKTVYDTDPFRVAGLMKKDGTPWIHMVDLDGARAGKPIQTDLIVAVQIECGLKVQAGGGIRTAESCRALLAGGVARAMIGSLAMKDPVATEGLLKEFGPERLTLALDVRIIEGTPYLTSQGWEVTEKKDLWSTVEHYEKMGFRHVLCTDVSKDGTLKGPNLALYREFVARFPKVQLQASGGVSTLQDVKDIKAAGLAGVVVGKALYEGVFTLPEALAC